MYFKVLDHREHRDTEEGKIIMELKDLKPGQILKADAGFTCLEDSQLCHVHEDKTDGLFIKCANGSHYLCGQVGDDGHISGLTLQ